jgi:AcrR family transcriptional regulator
VAGYVRAAERREQLLAAAERVLVSDGLEHLTLRGVAADAGVRLSALQYIFPSRADLVRALVDHVLDRASYGQFEVGTGGLGVELHRLVDWYSDQFVSDPAVIELVRQEVITRVSLDSPIRSTGFPEAGLIATEPPERRFAEIAQAAGEEYDQPIEDLGRLFALAQMGLIVEALEEPDVDRYRRDAHFLVESIVEFARPHPRGA